MTPNAPSPRREWQWIAAMTLLGLVLRMWGFGRLGLTHFDEGIYAFAGLWSVTPNGLDPSLIPYAPPGFPLLVGLGYLFLGVGDAPALLVPVLCGAAAIPLIGSLGRRAFGPGAGAAAATFAALSLAHVAFSRKALTDSTFLLTWLAALRLGIAFLDRPGLLRAIMLGVAVGLAQNVKYNGGMTGVAVAIAAALGLAGSPALRTRKALWSTFGLGLLAATVAGLLYLPWYRFVETHGGYAGLMKHHRGYVGGWDVWLPHLRQQLDQAEALSGGWAWGVFSGVAALLGGLFARGREYLARPEAERALFLTGWLMLLTFYPALAWFAGVALLPLVFRSDPGPRTVAAWWLLLAVMTPFYHPYARLWLPLHACGWLVAGGVLVSLTRSSFGSAEPERFQPDWLIGAILLCLVWWGIRAGGPPTVLGVRPVLAATTGLREACAKLAAQPDGGAEPLRVLARRPLTFYMALQGRPAFVLLADPAAIKAGPGSRGDRVLLDRAAFPENRIEAAALQGWRILDEYPTTLDPVTLLDVRPGAIYESSPDASTSLLLLEPAP